jgi:hypothetical protein
MNFLKPPYCFPILVLLKSEPLLVSSTTCFSCALISRGMEGVSPLDNVMTITAIPIKMKKRRKRLPHLKRCQREEELV